MVFAPHPTNSQGEKRTALAERLRVFDPSDSIPPASENSRPPTYDFAMSTRMKRHFVAITPHSLHVVRAAGDTIEHSSEGALAEAASVQAILSDWSEGALVSAIAAVAPQPVYWHLSKPEEACRLRSDAEVQRFAVHLPHGFSTRLEVIGCDAADGLPVSSDDGRRWLLGVTPGDSLANAAAEAIERGIVTAALGASTLGCIGAAAAAVRLDGGGTVLLWDIGRKRSHVFTINLHGVQAVAPCKVGFDAIFGAVQQVLGVKTPAAAARLFFNDMPAAKAADIAAALAPQVTSALGAAPAASEPVAFACTGLTGKHPWFGREMARVAGLPLWEPDLNRFLDHLQMKLAPAPESAPSPDLLGALHLAAAQVHGRPAWHPAWGSISRGGTSRPVPAETGERAEPLSAAPTRVEHPELPRESVPARQPAAHAPARLPDAVPAGTLGGRGGLDPDALTTAPSPTVPVPTPGSPSSKVAPGTPAPGAKPPGHATPKPLAPVARATPKPAPPPPTRPVATNGGNASPPPRPLAAAVTTVPPQEPVVIILRRRGYWPVLGLVLALMGAAIAGKFYFDAAALKSAAADEKAMAAEQVRLAEERARELAQAAAGEAERIRQEAEAARQAAVAQARREVEDQTRRQLAPELEAARTANAPGILTIATSPAGAEVSVDGHPPRRAPASIEDLPPGRHQVKISLAGHVPVELTTGIFPSETTDLGLIKLERATGAMAITSAPAGLEFSLHPVETPAGAAPLRHGRTPARLDDLPAGEYVVQFSRAGWPERTERVTVARGATARAAATFQGGAVSITSTPPGATVKEADNVLGTTPLILTDVPPRELTFELSADGYEALRLSGTVAGGRQLELDGVLLPLDRLASEEELRALPRPFITGPLKLGRLPRSAPSQVTVSFVVQRDGSLRDVEVLGKVDRTIARRSVEAIAQWRFYPAISHGGYPVDFRMTVPVDISRN
jgi:hypothetical protein